MKIDIHNHFYPTRVLEQLKKDGPAVGLEVKEDEWGRQILVHLGNRIGTITAPMTDIKLRLEDMDRVGFDMQILSVSIPCVDILPIESSETMAKVINDETAKICADHPNRFMALASLPFLDPDRTIKELERSIDDLKFQGACIRSQVNGVRLDNELFHPFYERMAEYDLPIHLHPATLLDTETYRDYRLGPMIGFEMELCVAVVRLVMGGVLERFPNLKFIVSHLGGAIPYLAERIQNCYEAYPECQEHISAPAIDYLRQFYYDTVSFFEPALMCAYAFVGAERLILGSDYPHVIGDIREAITSVENLKIPQADKEMIFSGNILQLTHRDA